MGRAYEVRKVSIMKTGKAKSKLYSTYSKEIYQAAKSGGVELESNYTLKKLIDKAKTDQVPTDVIKRAIDKVTSGIDENYTSVKYEIFGPSGSTLIVDCVTDNVNRSVSDVRTVINKCHLKMGSIGSVSYNYDNLAIVAFRGLNEEETFLLLADNDIDIDDIETNEDITVVYGKPSDSNEIKSVIESKLKDVEFITDEISFIPKETITLEDIEEFNKALTMFEDIEDVVNVYHNVNL